MSIELLVTFGRNTAFPLNVSWQPRRFVGNARFSQWKGCPYLKADRCRACPAWNREFLLASAGIAHRSRAIVRRLDW